MVCESVSAGDWEKIPAELASPWTTPARSWFIGGTLLTGLAIATEYEIEMPLKTDWSKRKPLGTWSDVGDYYGQFIPNAAYALGMGIAYWSTGENLYSRRAALMLKGSGYAVSVNYALKLTARVRRPNGSDNKSFPSGHAASAFAFSTVVWAEHGWKYGVPATMLAALTGASRINDNMHYLDDVIFGSTVGISYGLGVWYLSQNDPTSVSKWSFTPVLAKDLQMGLVSMAF